jgi:hypothetical protein
MLLLIMTKDPGAPIGTILALGIDECSLVSAGDWRDKEGELEKTK